MKWIGIVAGMALVVAGCAQHVMVPQLVRSYVIDRPQSVGPDGRPLASQAVVMVANEPYLRDQCANQVRVGGAPLHAGPVLDRVGCVRLAPGDRAEIIVPDTTEQAALDHELEHLKGRWCHDAQGGPTACPR
ncbi:MAG TPA: hypothetical protein VIG69_02015 [Candidatus Methylomirabilis sp.]